MGNGQSQSQSRYGNIFVRTDKPYYYAGEKVSGVIYLNLAVTGFPGNTLYLKVKGKETTHWTTTKEHKVGSGKTSVKFHETVHHNGHNLFFRQKFPLHAFQGQQLEAGQYAFPFTFNLNSGIPGSFDEQNAQFRAQIQYKVKGEISSFQDPKIKIKHYQEIIVRELVKEQVQTLLQGEMTTKVSTWCCIKQGESLIRCTFEKNQYVPGETAKLWVEVDNSNCNLDVQKIIGVINRKITMRSNYNETHVYTTDFSRQDIQGVLGVLAKATAINENKRSMDILLINLMKPSTNGIMVKCEYSLNVTSDLKGCRCCDTDPFVQIPINIQAAKQPSYDEVPKVENWNPQQFETVDLNFSEKNHEEKDNKDPNKNQSLGNNDNIVNMNQNQMV